MANLTLDYRLKPWEIFGGKRPFFMKYAELIGDVIKDFKLEPVQKELIAPALRPSEFAEFAKMAKFAPTSEMMAYIDPGIYGGKRFAHLHYRGEIYMLNQDQWRTFTGRTKDDLINKLKMADSISVEQFQDLSDAIDPLA